jgi:hypothetical protein
MNIRSRVVQRLQRVQAQKMTDKYKRLERLI